MSLISKDLFLGKVDKVKIAIERLIYFKRPEWYYLAFGGGKDSLVCKTLCDMAKVKYEAHFHITTVDPPELTYYIRKYHKDVIFDRPKYTMRQLIAKKCYPPTRQARYCCEYLKEGRDSYHTGGKGQFVITGVRWAESFKRSKRKMMEVCLRDKTKHYLNVIIDWSDEDVWEFIRKYKLPYCSLYDKGFSRIGCIGCPLSSNQEKELEMYPKIKNLYLKAFVDMIANRKIKGLEPLKFQDDVMTWWLGKCKEKENPDQTIMFE